MGLDRIRFSRFVGLIGVLVLLATGLTKPASAAADQPGPSPRRVALVIGIGAYEHLPALTNPANDAALIAHTLQDLGFTLIGNGAQINLDKAGFLRAIQSLGAALETADVALFYYAGHGLQVQGTNWLVPIGANPASAMDLDFQMVDADLVLKQMRYARARLNVVILDACRNNPFSGRGLRATQGGLAEMRAPDGTLIAYATQPGNVARDGAGANSPFTAALAATMRQPGLDVFRLFNQVGLLVKRETSGDQQPWVSSSPIDGDFYFSGVGPNGAPATPPADPDLIFWQSIADHGSQADYEAYLQRFPAGRFAPLAQSHLQKDPPPSRTPGIGLQALLAPFLQPAQPPRDAAPSVFAASVRAVNVVSLFAEDSYRDYIHQFDPARGPSGKETNVRVTQLANSATTPALATLKRALAQQSAGAPRLAGYVEVYEAASVVRPWPSPPDASMLVPLAQRYLQEAEALIAVLGPAEFYYDQQNYRDDNFAKGRAMHAPILTAYRNLLSTGEDLRALLRSLAEQERTTYLNSLPPETRALKTAELRNVAQARHLVQFMAANLGAVKDIRKIDLARLKSEIDLVDQSLADLRAAVGSKPISDAMTYGPNGIGDLNRYIEVSGKFLAESRYVWRSVRDRLPIDEHNFTFGTRYDSDLINAFNDLANMANPPD